MTDDASALGRVRSKPILIALGAIVLAELVAAGILIATSSSSSPIAAASSSTSSTSTSAAASSGTIVEAVSVPRLRALPALVGHPVYWAGPRKGITYELTRSPDGRVYIRYLTGGAKVGSPLPYFLTIGTYVIPNAAAAVRAAAAQPGAIRVSVPGGIGFYNRVRPTSVYFAYPGSNVQIETYAPSAAVARKLVETGVIKPLS